MSEDNNCKQSTSNGGKKGEEENTPGFDIEIQLDASVFGNMTESH